MFDSVFFDCPKCGYRIEVQSKAGNCVLTSFDEGDVPVAIAADIEGQVVRCENDDCRAWLKVRSALPIRVPMALIPTRDPAGDADDEEEE